MFFILPPAQLSEKKMWYCWLTCACTKLCGAEWSYTELIVAVLAQQIQLSTTSSIIRALQPCYRSSGAIQSRSRKPINSTESKGSCFQQHLLCHSGACSRLREAHTDYTPLKRYLSRVFWVDRLQKPAHQIATDTHAGRWLHKTLIALIKCDPCTEFLNHDSSHDVLSTHAQP